MTPEREEEIRRWRARAKVSDLEEAPWPTLAAVLDQWLMVVDELLEALVDAE